MLQMQSGNTRGQCWDPIIKSEFICGAITSCPSDLIFSSTFLNQVERLSKARAFLPFLVAKVLEKTILFHSYIWHQKL